MPDRLYRWAWKARLPERRGQLCRLICTGTLNSALVEFLEDGRRWLMHYPRGLTTFDCARVLDMHGGDVAQACAFIERRLPVPPDQRAPLVARRRDARVRLATARR